jgi:hypothetical protein
MANMIKVLAIGEEEGACHVHAPSCMRNNAKLVRPQTAGAQSFSSSPQLQIAIDDAIRLESTMIQGKTNEAQTY